jgi:hypothetical protein
MKRWLKVVMFCLLLLGISSNLSASTNMNKQAKVDYTKPIDPDILTEKTLSEIWLMRNEIFARHGRPFKTYELYHYFMATGWYQPDKNYSESRLSQVESENAERIRQEEEKRLRDNYSTRNRTSYVNVNNILNIFQYPQFTPEEIKLLGRNGFVTLPTKYNQLFHIYENNDYLGIPSFITVDSVLQLYHLFFDMTLRHLEQQYLSDVLATLLCQVIEQTKQIYREAEDEAIKNAALHNWAYFSIPYYFLKGGKVNLEDDIKDLAFAEIELCQAHRGWDDSPLLRRKFDYSQFIPRGHYTRNEVLKQYFLAMLWLGLAGIDIKDDSQILQGLMTTCLLYTKSFDGRRLIEFWDDVYQPTVFYVGLSDDLGPVEFKEAMDRVFGEDLCIIDFSDSQKLAQIRGLLTETFATKTKITGHGEWGEQGPQFRFMGQRFIPDSHIFQRLTIIDRRRNYFRYFPNGLDVIAVFGSKKAKTLMLTELTATWEQWPEYPQEFERVIAEYKNLSKAQWTQNLYYYWLWCLKALINLKETGPLPFFMKTEGWERKSLNTALGSWAELRHDTILYAKQSYAAECGNGDEELDVWIPEPPKGYVEPNVEFYQRLLSLLEFTRKELSARKMIDSRMISLFTRFAELVEFLLNVSEKELDNTPLTLQEYEQIQKMGALLDNLTLAVLTEGTSVTSWMEIEGPDKNMPVIADVHTADTEVLEVGVGKAHEMYVIVEIDGRLKLTRGAIFSYYEFPWPIDDRLTDQKWQELLEVGKEPALPAWSNTYRSPEKKQKTLKPLYLPPPGIPDWSPEPGWKVIYYDTGC